MAGHRLGALLGGGGPPFQCIQSHWIAPTQSHMPSQRSGNEKMMRNCGRKRNALSELNYRGWGGQGLIRTPGPTVCALTCASQLGRTIHSCPLSMPAGLLTAPVPRGGTCGREMPPCLCAWVVCCLVLPAGEAEGA